MANQSWAPQSPDLSGYAPQSPDLSAFKPKVQQSNWAPQSPDVNALPGHHSGYHQPPPPPPNFSLDNGYGAPPYQPQPYSNFPHHHQQQTSHPIYYPQSEMPVTTRSHRVKNEDRDWMPKAEYPSEVKPLPAQAMPRKKMDTRGVEVKTKFPTARIKRIMQADEDVGKVAQVTPVVMAKALELFMIQLITASSDVAKARGSKRVQTSHMKNAVMSDEQFDNLREIMDKVPDAPTKKGAAEADSDDDDEGAGAGAAAAAKKRKKSTAGAKGKKRKGSDDDY